MQHDRPIVETTRASVAPALLLMMVVALLAACSSGVGYDDAVARSTPLSRAPTERPHSREISRAVAIGPAVVGFASWYRRGPHLYRTCAGKPLLDNGLFAASPVLPVGTQVEVTLLNDDRSVIVMVDDCMPRGHRIIDLSVEAARQLGLLERGVGMVRVTPVAWR